MNVEVPARYSLLWALKEEDEPLYQLLWEVRSSVVERTESDMLALTKDTIRWLVGEGYAEVSELTSDGWRALNPDGTRFAGLLAAAASWEPAENGDRNRVVLTTQGAQALESGTWASEFDPRQLLMWFRSAQTDQEQWAYADALAATAGEDLADDLVDAAFEPGSGRAGGVLLIAAARVAGVRLRPSIELAIEDPRLRFLARKALGELDG